MNLFEWFDETREHALVSGNSLVLETALGTIAVVGRNLAATELYWPPSAIGDMPASTPPIATICCSSATPPNEIESLLSGPPALRSDRTGRGAYPVRWCEGTVWLAKHEDGPLIARRGPTILITTDGRLPPERIINRVLRELVVRLGGPKSFRLMHAAVVSGRMGGLLVSGTSGAGKTDLAIKTARWAEATVVAVDRAILSPTGSSRAVGGATPFGLNIFGATLFAHGLTPSGLSGQRFSNGKYYLGYATAEQLLGIRTAAQGIVSAVVTLVPGPRTSWEPLNDHGLRRAVHDADLHDADPGFPADWLGLGGLSLSGSHRWAPSLGWKIEYNPARAMRAALLDTLANIINGPRR